MTQHSSKKGAPAKQGNHSNGSCTLSSTSMEQQEVAHVEVHEMGV